MGWQMIESQVLSIPAASVTFSNIPQTYKTLKLMVSAQNDTGDVAVFLYPNSATTNLSDRELYGDGTNAASISITTGANVYANPNNYTARTFASTEVTFPNYFGSTNKPYLIEAVTENNGTTSYLGLNAGLWSSTTAITSIKLQPRGTSGNFVFGSTFTLYGLI